VADRDEPKVSLGASRHGYVHGHRGCGGERPEPRGSRTTTAERQAVYLLADEGLSVHAIALEVFGDRRFKDRVARLLRGRPPAERPSSPQDELARLRVQIIRTNMAAVERLNAMTRQPRQG